MKHYYLLFGLIIAFLLSSCAVNTKFDSLKKAQTDEANVVVNAPVWLAKIFVPADAKEEVSRLAKGMKKLRVLVASEEFGKSMKDTFNNLSEDPELTSYILVKDDGNEVNVLAKQDGDIVSEILILFETEEESGILGLSGKMRLSNFQEALEKGISSNE